MKTNWFILAVLALCLTTDASLAVDANPAPLPTLKELFNHVLERARKESENDRIFATNYVFIRSKTKEFRNEKGEIKKQETKVRTNDPAAIIASMAALNLEPEQPQPDEPNEPDQPVSDTHSNVRGKALDRDEFLESGDVVKRFDFRLEGREMVNGRPALLVEFHPKDGRQPVHSLKDKFINKAAGRVWIDEGDYALVKANLWLTERVNVLGGLLGAVWKFTTEIERERLDDGLWFTREWTWHLEGRELFIHRTVDFHEERTDLRRFEGSAGPTTAALGY